MQYLSDAHKNFRLEYCRLMVENIHADRNFFNNILWTDESTFSTSGIPNRKNVHHWASENPRDIRPVRFSGRQSIHVWCGIYHGGIIGPIFFRENLTGARYRDMVNDILNQLRNDGNVMENIIWQHDGAPPHNTVNVRNLLSNTFPVWIGRFGTIHWPANSPDLTPLDTFLWGFLKNKIYINNDLTIFDIQQQIIEQVNFLNENPDIIITATDKLKSHYRLCVQEHGGHIEHLHRRREI